MPAVALTGFQLFNRPVAIGAKGSPLSRAITEIDRLVQGKEAEVMAV